MARIKLELPETFSFKTEIPVRVTDINYGGHLGNDSLLSILQEARVQFFQSHHQTELKFYDASVIMADVAIIFKGESFHGDVLQIEIAVSDFTKVSFDIYYRVTELKSKKEIAHAKTGMVCFDYVERKVKGVPEEFKLAIGS